MNELEDMNSESRKIEREDQHFFLECWVVFVICLVIALVYFYK